ncbi:dihydrodipicolinate synthase family protein [Roseibium sp. M-1]
MTSIRLPNVNGNLFDYQLRGHTCEKPDHVPVFNRVAYAAAHVVADPGKRKTGDRAAPIDFEATLAFRKHLWSLGFGIAEVMDTAQRGMGLGWEDAKIIISNTVAASKLTGNAPVACGVGTDHLREAPETLSEVLKAYEEQLDYVAGQGATPIIMASRALRHIATSANDYLFVYERLLANCPQQVILHWLGAAFDPMLEGYWGSPDIGQANETVLSLISRHESKVDGIKISLLDKDHEIAFRRRLPGSVRLYTGDDFNYPDLIHGDELGYSDALLGVLDPIAPVASRALEHLARGEDETYFQLMNPTLPLARKIFEAPTQYYKAGVVFLAWLNGQQAHFDMLDGFQTTRSVVHFSEVFQLADQADLFTDPDLAAARMKAYLNVNFAQVA